MTTIQQPVVAGTFYPADAQVLQQMLTDFLYDAQPYASLNLPKAIIAPHAGYIYSGPIAASAYACLHGSKGKKIKNVVILAPAHRYPVAGIVTTDKDFYATPLGNVKIAKKLVAVATTLPFVIEQDEVFNTEHSLEVQLPFLQMVLEDFSIVPFLVGDVTPAQVATLLELLWGDDETLIVISSDLSHYHSYERAQKMDAQAAKAVVELNQAALREDMACGNLGLRGLLTIAAAKKMRAVQIDLRNSGDTAGPKDQVVGYGAFHIRKF